MSTTLPTKLELRTYLKKSDTHLLTVEMKKIFSDFLDRIQKFFKMRVKAEAYFKAHRYLAERESGALPIGWEDIDTILNPKTEEPEESLITEIARKLTKDLECILKEPRRTLIRHREQTSLAKVKQLDSQCLTWLNRQSGRTIAEKAGVKQKVLAIVRRIDYNTLENRVLKDLMQRAEGLAIIYLNKHKNAFPEHELIRLVKKFIFLCHQGIALPEMEEVSALTEVPLPNYVLQQDRSYKKIWKYYRLVLQQTQIFEHLWDNRETIRFTLEDLSKYSDNDKLFNLSQNNRYPMYQNTPWINPITGKGNLFDQLSLKNEYGEVFYTSDLNPHKKELQVVDLTTAESRYDRLVTSIHANGKPYLQRDDWCKYEDQAISQDRIHTLENIIKDAQKKELLRQYFEALHAVIGGERWIILIPDDWGTEQQQSILETTRSVVVNRFLLWRSIALYLGSNMYGKKWKDRALVTVRDKGCNYSHICLTIRTHTDGRSIPARRSYKNNNTAIVYCHDLDYRYDINRLRHTLFEGAKRFNQERSKGIISYYDELEGLYLIVQDAKEECIKVQTLIEATLNHPGGEEYKGEEFRDVRIGRDEKHVKFYLAMGECSPKHNDRLRLYEQQFPRTTTEEEGLILRTSATPGQGYSCVRVTTANRDVLEEALTLDFSLMQETMMTISILENEIDRSFPPDIPEIESDQNWWRNVRPMCLDCLNNGWLIEPNKFGQPKYIDQNVLGIDQFKRKNIFGWNKLPKDNTQFDFDAFFHKLYQRYLREKDTQNGDYLRIIAWIYQRDNKLFYKVKLDQLTLLSEGNLKKDQGFTLLGHYANSQKDWGICLKAIEEKLKQGVNGINDYLRLFHYLLSLNNTMLEHQEMNRMQDFARLLFNCCVNAHPSRQPIIHSNALKSLLFLLRYRRYRADFLREGELYNEIHRFLSSKPNGNLRALTLRYLEGKGILDGLPLALK